MGCCESKLLNSPQTLTPIQPSSCSQEIPQQLQPVDIKLVQIGLHNNFANTDRNSLQSLQLDLQAVLQKFEAHKGTLTYTFQQAKIQQQTQNNQNCRDRKKSLKQLQHNSGNSEDTFTGTDYEQQSYQKEGSSQISQCFQNNINILQNASINTKKALQKQLFYINSCKIDRTNLLKWSQKQRMPVNFQQESLKNMLKHQKELIFAAAIFSIYFFEKSNKLKLFAIQNNHIKKGIRLFVNGTKRMLQIKSKSQNLAQDLLTQLSSFLIFFNSVQLSYWIYCLTGWIPQTINLTVFPDPAEILKRIINNFYFGNILISFTNQAQTQFLLLNSISQEMQTVTLNKIFRQQNQNKLEQNLTLSWDQVSQKYPFLNVNWNPIIYSFNKKLQSINICQQGGNMYTSAFILEIPPSKNQVQLRIMVQKHIESVHDMINNLSVKLYESEGNLFDISKKHPIKQTNSKNGKFISQIFIFQKSSEKSQYILTIESNYAFPHQNMQMSIDLFSFCLINVRKISKPVLLTKKIISQTFIPQYAGFGMNSPFFTKNLHYSLTFEREIHCKIKVKIQSTQQAIFQLCILPDEHKYKDITLVKPQNIIKDIIQSEEFQNEGILEFTPNRSSYILILVCFSPCFGKVDIQIQSYCLNPEQSQKGKSECFNMHKLNQYKQFQKQHNFYWNIDSPGPRKRTKLNSLSNFCPISFFQTFFLNPSIDLQLDEAYYQLSISSISFLNFLENIRLTISEMNKQQVCEKLLSASPPSLSLGIYQLNTDKTYAKIILDDHSYIPYGIGFWTSPIKLNGSYRFVFSKLEKGQQQGIFRIRKIKQINK